MGNLTKQEKKIRCSGKVQNSRFRFNYSPIRRNVFFPSIRGVKAII